MWTEIAVNTVIAHYITEKILWLTLPIYIMYALISDSLDLRHDHINI